MENNSPKIGSTNTKNEILDAYNELLKKVSDGKQMSLQDVKKKKDDETLITKVSELTLHKIVTNLGEVKLVVAKWIDDLESKLEVENRRFADLQCATKLKQDELEELYEIKKNADSLAALIAAQREQRERFTVEMAQKKNELEEEISETKTSWDKERETATLEWKDQQARVKKERQREEEEYRYNLNIERKKDKDQYEIYSQELANEIETKRSHFEKEIADREACIKTNEEQFKMLQTQAAKFPQELDLAVKNAEKATGSAIETRYKHQIELTAREIEGERKLAIQTIASLQAKIKEHELLIKQLTDKANESTQQVQSIALKAIESSSSVRFYPGFADEGKKQVVNG